MQLSEEDRKELKTLFSESFAEGIALFRSKTEEEAAKLKSSEEDKPKEVKGDDTGFSLSGFLLGK